MIVILAGVTMNALFAWMAFTFLAAKNGRQIDPSTTVGAVVEEMIPDGGGGSGRIRRAPGLRASRPPVDVVERRRDGIANAPEPESGSGWPAAEVGGAADPGRLEQRLKASPGAPAVPARGRGQVCRDAGRGGRVSSGRHHPRHRRPADRPVVRHGGAARRPAPGRTWRSRWRAPPAAGRSRCRPRVETVAGPRWEARKVGRIGVRPSWTCAPSRSAPALDGGGLDSHVAPRPRSCVPSAGCSAAGSRPAKWVARS